MGIAIEGNQTKEIRSSMSDSTGQLNKHSQSIEPKRTYSAWIISAGIGGIVLVVGLCATLVVLCVAAVFLTGSIEGWSLPFNTEKTSMPASTPASTSAVGSTMVSDKDGMVLVYVPAGRFLMGIGDEQKNVLLKQHYYWYQTWFITEQPQHTVSLDAFWIDQTEVTNAQYAKCVAAGACSEPHDSSSYTHTDGYYDISDFADYPVIYVDWDMAKSYCYWAGRRLPTEAEWEKAARGTDGRIYPWGNKQANCDLANFDVSDDGSEICVGDTEKVGSHPDGASPYGALDMVGNVSEWVADWFLDVYYDQSPDTNPRGPSSGWERVFRGGSWYTGSWYSRSSSRDMYVSDYNEGDLGFRCAR